MTEKNWDVFISHASEDKETVAKPLAEALERAGVRVWMDINELALGDSLSEMIDQGLADSEFGVVIISPAFFAKHWPRKELSGLRAREEGGRKVVLPVWHNVIKEYVADYSPTLADAFAVSTDQGIEAVAQKILAVVFDASTGSSKKAVSITRRLNKLLDSDSSKDQLIAFFQSTFFLGSYPQIFHLIFRNSWLHFGVAFGRHTYDMAAYYVGHGIGFELVVFTDVFGNPFEYPVASPPKVDPRILQAIAGVRSTMEWFEVEPKAATSKLIENVDGAESLYFRHPELFPIEKFPLEFYVFAGRRSAIDATPESHTSWSQLLIDNSDIRIKTYDKILDAYIAFEHRTRQWHSWRPR